MIFGLRNTDNFQFYIGHNAISICDEYKYLGVIFTKTRSFYKAIKHNVEQAKKALHLLYKRINSLQIPIDLQLQIFDHTILPILLYGCEVWGFQNTDLIEKVHNQFLRNITKTRKSTPLYMLYAELGRSPINLQIKKRMLGYWISILNGSDTKIVKKMYQILYNDFVNRGINHKWIGKIRQILISVGKPDLLHQHNIQHPPATKLKISQTLHDIFLQDWNATINTTSKGRNYKLFKTNTNFETFLISLPRSSSIPMIKFRTANHKLPIEVGRWENIVYEDRKCNFCDKNDLGDEFHYLFICSYFQNERKDLLKRYYYLRPNIIKYQELMNCKNKQVLLNLSKFMKLIMSKFV